MRTFLRDHTVTVDSQFMLCSNLPVLQTGLTSEHGCIDAEYSGLQWVRPPPRVTFPVTSL